MEVRKRSEHFGVGMEEKWRALIINPLLKTVWSFLLASMLVSAERSLKYEALGHNATLYSDSFSKFFKQSDNSGYEHVWPEMEFNWQIVVGSIIGFLGAAFGSVGGVGGGGIFVPMLTLIMGFDPKSATAVSKCMIMGVAASTVFLNLKLRHPTLDVPIIDYDLAVLIQPVLLLGISIGVTFNVIFADWMVTMLLIVLFIFTSTKAFLKGVETWKKETTMMQEAARRLEADGIHREGAVYQVLPGGPRNNNQEMATDPGEPEVSIMRNVCWKEVGILVFVWISFLLLQISKNKTVTCSAGYWVVNLLQIPISVAVSSFEAVNLYKGWRKIASQGDAGTNFQVRQLIIYCSLGVFAGLVGGLLGVGGGSIMGPLFLELGVPPQVSSATASFAMLFSSSMSVVEYYLLQRFPVPYALYFVAVATIAAFVGQHVARRIISMLGRASIIIFVLGSIILVSAISLGGVGIANAIGKIQQHEYMGFENLCK